MIDLMDTILGEKLRKMANLSDAIAWYEAFTPAFKKEILSWIQDDQLRKRGVDEDGDVIGEYSLYTQILSGGRKKFGDHYTLEDTGEFFKSMYVVVLSDSIVIEADPIKGNDNLFFKYGEGIIGLTEENIEYFQLELADKYREYARKVLQLD